MSFPPKANKFAQDQKVRVDLKAGHSDVGQIFGAIFIPWERERVKPGWWYIVVLYGYPAFFRPLLRHEDEIRPEPSEEF